MVIDITRSGGFAGIIRKAHVDTAALPPPLRSEIEAIVSHLRQAMPPAGGTADAFVYEVRIDGMRFTVPDEDPAWRKLIERVFAIAGLQ